MKKPTPPRRSQRETPKLLKRMAKFQATKDTPQFAAMLEREKYRARVAITRLGYTPQRADKAITDYLDEAMNSRLGPDLPGFVKMIQDIEKTGQQALKD